jgi:L-lactate dehydrogenase
MSGKEQTLIQKRSGAMVGAGNVGVAAAYAMFIKQTAGELIPIDQDRYRAEGEAMDLTHGRPFTGNISVRAGDCPDLGNTQVVVIAAGAAQRPGEKRTGRLYRSVEIFGKIAAQLAPAPPCGDCRGQQSGRQYGLAASADYLRGKRDEIAGALSRTTFS